MLVAIVALSLGQGEANPKDALALIFAIIGVFIVLLFTIAPASAKIAPNLARRIGVDLFD